MSDVSMKEIRLYGEMRRKFGESFRLRVRNAAEASAALQAMVPGFKEYLRSRYNAPFAVLVNKRSVGENQLMEPIGASEVIKFVPLVQGSKNPFVSIVLGGALMLASPFLGWAAPYAFSLGLSMVLGGVAQILAPVPKQPADTTKDKETWALSTPTLTAGQGVPVYVGWGLVRIGGHIISCGVDTMTWQVGGFGGLCATDDGVCYGDGGVTAPYTWAIDER